jgi:thiamine-phosphate pyrophosphorylase
MLRCAITNDSSFPTRSPLLADATRWAAAPLDLILLREPHLPAADLTSLARDILAILRAHNAPTRLLIHSRPDIAVATSAHGVHLSSRPGQLTPAQVRSIFAASASPTPFISLSCHNLAEVERASAAPQNDRPDLILFAPVFEKRLHDTIVVPGTGLDLLHHACLAASPIPVLALGGITAANTPSCLAAGAAGIAAIRLFS